MPASVPVPYVGRIYDSPNQDRLSDLIRLRGASSAEAERRAGDLAAQRWSNLGQIVGQSLSSLATYQANAPRRQLEALKVEEETRQAQRQQGLDRLLSAQAWKPDELQAALVQGGYLAEAKQFDQYRAAQTKDALEHEKLLAETAHQHLSEVPSLVESMVQVPADQQAERWRAVIAPALREKVGPVLAAQIPDAYDPELARGIGEWGKTTAEKSKALADAAEIAARTTKTADERDQNAREAMIRVLAGSTTQDEWSKGVAIGKAAGGKPDTMALFGETFSPEAQARVKRMAATTGRSESDYGRFLALSPDQQAEELRQRAGFYGATRAPSRPPRSVEALTSGQLIQAKARRTAAIRSAEKEFRTAQTVARQSLLDPTYTADDLIAAKADIERAYQDEIGEAPVPAPVTGGKASSAFNSARDAGPTSSLTSPALPANPQEGDTAPVTAPNGEQGVVTFRQGRWVRTQ